MFDTPQAMQNQAKPSQSEDYLFRVFAMGDWTEMHQQPTNLQTIKKNKAKQSKIKQSKAKQSKAS